MIFVNHGARTRMEHTDYPNGGYMIQCVHDGPDNHHLLQPGQQCECGQLGLGIIRDSALNVNAFEPFYENFTSLTDIGIDFAAWEPAWLAEAKRKDNSRWRRFLRWIGATPRPLWKPCVQIGCPPIEEYEFVREGGAQPKNPPPPPVASDKPPVPPHA